jgi:hypothetical protein
VGVPPWYWLRWKREGWIGSRRQRGGQGRGPAYRRVSCFLSRYSFNALSHHVVASRGLTLALISGNPPRRPGGPKHCIERMKRVRGLGEAKKGLVPGRRKSQKPWIINEVDSVPRKQLTKGINSMPSVPLRRPRHERRTTASKWIDRHCCRGMTLTGTMYHKSTWQVAFRHLDWQMRGRC